MRDVAGLRSAHGTCSGSERLAASDASDAQELRGHLPRHPHHHVGVVPERAPDFWVELEIRPDPFAIEDAADCALERRRLIESEVVRVREDRFEAKLRETANARAECGESRHSPWGG